MRNPNHRTPAKAAMDRIAELELVRDGLARELAAVTAERDELRATLDRINAGMARRLDRLQAGRVRQDAPELAGAPA